MKRELFFHVCSKGLKSDILFENAEEYISGMNRIAVCLQYELESEYQIRLIAFCLMDNHVHFVLYGSEEAVDSFIQRYKKLTNMWINKHRENGLTETIIFNSYPIWPDSKLKEKVIYVLRNPVAAKMGYVPSGYRWSSGPLMFNENGWITGLCKKMTELSMRKKKQLFYTAVCLPEEWIVLPDGLIWPGCYTDYRYAEQLFSSIGDYLYMLNTSNIDKIVNEEMCANDVSAPDSEVKKRADETAFRIYGKETLRECSPRERVEIARLLKKEKWSGVKQLARITGLKVEDLKDLV